MKLRKITIDNLIWVVRNKLYSKRHIDIDSDLIIKNLKDPTDYVNYKNKVSLINFSLKELWLDVISNNAIKNWYTKHIVEKAMYKFHKDVDSLESIMFYIIETSSTVEEIYDKIEEHYNITMERLCIK